MCLGVRPEGRLRCFSHPLGGVEFSGRAQYPAFAPDTLFLLQALQKWQLGGFPGGAVVENLPANAGDTGSSPGLRRSHMPRSN